MMYDWTYSGGTQCVSLALTTLTRLYSCAYCARPSSGIIPAEGLRRTQDLGKAQQAQS
nr:hypothetical protein [uncultured Mediterranean phage uvMED]